MSRPQAAGSIATASPLLERVPATRAALADGALREALRTAIAQRGAYCDWCVEPSGWVVSLHLPHERTFAAATLEDALAGCLDWLMSLPPRSQPAAS